MNLIKDKAWWAKWKINKQYTIFAFLQKVYKIFDLEKSIFIHFFNRLSDHEHGENIEEVISKWDSINGNKLDEIKSP